MSKRERPPITVKAYVKVNGVETDVDTLDEARRGQLATAIQVTVLNTFCRTCEFLPGGGRGQINNNRRKTT